MTSANGPVTNKCAMEHSTAGKVAGSESGLPRGSGRSWTVEDNAPPDRRLRKIVIVGWFSLGVASVALALIAALLLHSERESTAILHHLSSVEIDLQNVLSDLADAEAEERAYILTPRSASLENFKRSRDALGMEFDRLAQLVKNQPLERQEVQRIRYLVEQGLNELQWSMAARTTAQSHAAVAGILTDRARMLTQTLAQTVRGLDEHDEGMLAQLGRRRRVRLASALAAVSGALLLAGSYLLVGQTIIARSASRRQRTEDALRASEQRFETLCEQAPVGIYQTDAQGRCIYSNVRWLQMSGLSAAESLGHGWKKALHPDDRETVFNGWKTAALQGASWEYRLMSPQGSIRWIRALGGPIYSPRGDITGYVGTTEDITEQKLAHRALQEREALNRAVLNSLPANIAVLDSHGTIQAVNEEWRRFPEANGNSPTLFAGVGVNYLEVCRRAAEDGSAGAGKALAGIQAVLAGGLRSFRTEYLYYSATGKRWFHMSITPLAGVTSGGVVVAHVDITQRKEAEDAVRQALQQLQLVTDNMPAAVVRCDRDLRYVWVSRTYTAWLRQAPEEVVGRLVSDVFGQEAFEVLRPHIDKVLSGEREEFETRMNFLPVGTRWVHAVYVPTIGGDQNVDGWVAVLADVTERHEAEERLRESEERFRATFYQAAVGIAQTNIDGNWLLLNDRCCEILGRSRGELRGKTFIDITHPDDREASFAAANRILAGEMSSWLTEKRYMRTDGSTVWARLSVSLVRGQHNEPLYFISVVEDITEKVLAERALQNSRRELRALAGRLINAEEEERKRISRELHDDLSQKLALLAFDTGSLVMAPPPTVEEMKEPLRGLQARVAQLSEDVRQISHQLHPSILEDLGLAAALGELCEEFSAREGIEAAFEPDNVPRVLPVDIASCLYRVSQEALHNVLKHAQATQVRLKIHAKPEGIHLCIHDDGIGFDSDSGFSRLGLGIVSMKERVGLVQGEFSIQSRPGKGTEINIFVPLPKEQA